MRRIYRVVAKRAKVAIAQVDTKDQIVAMVGFLTFFFGFGAGALLNLYLIAIHHPLVTQLRSVLTYRSAIVGDGFLLPILNMIAIAFILKNVDSISRKTVQLALLSAMAVTLYFHINQAVQGVVNWAMPTPWHWNILGLWHALYMFSVASLLSLFGILVVYVVKEEKEIPKEAMVVVLGLFAFFVLLHLDYLTVSPF